MDLAVRFGQLLRDGVVADQGNWLRGSRGLRADWPRSGPPPSEPVIAAEASHDLWLWNIGKQVEPAGTRFASLHGNHEEAQRSLCKREEGLKREENRKSAA